jgi:tRNA threonylcarbamoyladenosine biosynthesis protein TsaB
LLKKEKDAAGPLCLAVDSSGKTASAALMSDSGLIACYTENTGLTHSEKLMPMVDAMLRSVSVDVSEIDMFAAASGPGSFTGLRIGASSLKAMAHALGKPLFAVSTLDALCRNASGFDGLICPIIDARRVEVYTAVYESAAVSGGKILPECSMPLSELLEFLGERRVLFSGDGIIPYKDFILNNFKGGAVFAPPHLALQNAASAALIALERYANGERPGYGDFEIEYLKASQPEQKMLSQNNS